MREMKINIKNTTMVQPNQASAKRRMWLSNLDLVVPRIHVPTIYFYRSNGSSDFFDPNLVKEALGRALVSWYPVAGRLRMDESGKRIEIDCNDEGVLLMEAETTMVIDDFGDFSPTMEYMKLIPPRVDYSADISSYPLMHLQFTYFKCGGVSIGVGVHHIVADGFSVIGFINSWAGLTRGLDLTTLPSLDRTLLRARDPPCPEFKHIEYEPTKPLLEPCQKSAIITTRTFNIRLDQMNTLKSNECANYTSFEVLSGHIWRCVCKARGLSDTQPCKLYIPVDARSRLKSDIPLSYFANAIFSATPAGLVGDLVSNPVSYAANKIHEALKRMDDEYLRSAIDYIELHPDMEALTRRPHTFQNPNLIIASWAKLPLYDADFGWGKPAYMGPAFVKAEGLIYLVPTAGSTDGRLSLFISLEADHMEHFETYLYQI